VVYRIGGERVARFEPEDAGHRDAWDQGPRQAVTYEGRDCPVSALRTLAGHARDGGEVVYETEPPSVVGCNRYRHTSTPAATTIWIRPSEGARDCFSDFAVAVSLDGRGLIVSVDFTLSGT